MKDCNLKRVYRPVEKIVDPLTELLRNGARDLISSQDIPLIHSASLR